VVLALGQFILIRTHASGGWGNFSFEKNANDACTLTHVPCGMVDRVSADRHFSDFSFGIGMCLDLMSWVQQVHNAATVAGSLGCQCDTETRMPTGTCQ